MTGTWKIKYYSPLTGTSPIYEFIESLPPKAISKVYNTFQLLTEFGLTIREPHVKKLTGTPLWEIRILGEDNLRIFYVTVKESTFLLLHAFKKKKQKTPIKEIKIALSRLAEYKTRTLI